MEAFAQTLKDNVVLLCHIAHRAKNPVTSLVARAHRRRFAGAPVRALYPSTHAPSGQRCVVGAPGSANGALASADSTAAPTTRRSCIVGRSSRPGGCPVVRHLPARWPEQRSVPHHHTLFRRLYNRSIPKDRYPALRHVIEWQPSVSCVVCPFARRPPPASPPASVENASTTLRGCVSSARIRSSNMNSIAMKTNAMW